MTAHLKDKLFFIAVTIGFDFLRSLSGCLAWNKSKRLGCYLQSLLPTAIPCCKYGSQTRFAFYLLQVVRRTRVRCCNTSGVWWSAGATHRYYWCGHAGLGSLLNACYSHRQNKHCADAFSENWTHTEPEVLDYVVTDWYMLVLSDLVWRLTHLPMFREFLEIVCQGYLYLQETCWIKRRICSSLSYEQYSLYNAYTRSDCPWLRQSSELDISLKDHLQDKETVTFS